MANVILNKVCKSDGDVRVIEGLDLEIRDEELMVLAGPSGCGKSAALRMIAGLEEISGGEISIDGRVVNDVPPQDRDVAMVFQSYALYPHMSARDNLEFGLKIRKTDRAEINRRVNDAAEILGLVHLLERKPKQLSDGQRQRVAVARAIVRNPRVLLFDEPLLSLDALLRVRMRGEISKLQHRLKTTTVYVTRDQTEAMAMGHRIAILKDGDLQQVGTPLEVYESPRNVFVATFIGTPPMSFVNAKLTDGGRQLDTKHFQIPVPEAWLGLTRGSDGRELLLGIRPENLLDAGSTGRGATAGLRADVEVVEPRGHEVLVHAKVGDDLLVAKAGAHRTPRVGEPLDLIVELDDLHLFDPKNELRLA